MLLRKKFDLGTNAIHMVSLSCNPVPPVRYGGIELVVAHLCEGLVSKGARVVCYSPGELNISGVEHCQTMTVAATHIKEGGVPNTREHLRAIQQHLQQNLRAGDVIIFNHADHYRFLKKRLGIFRWLKVHACEIAHWTDAGMQKHVIYPSAHLMREIGKPGVVIPHGEKLLFNENPDQPREDFLFFAGRITRDKGVDIALAAARQLNVKLVLAGPLNEKAFAEPIISDPAVNYLGELTYADLFTYYTKAKALVYMTQYTEPFGLSVIEAMAAGCPVITTGKGGTGETVLPGKTGYFCQTAEDIAQAYGQLDKICAADCIERARDYSIEKMTDAYLSYIMSLR